MLSCTSSAMCSFANGFMVISVLLMQFILMQILLGLRRGNSQTSLDSSQNELFLYHSNKKSFCFVLVLTYCDIFMGVLCAMMFYR